MGGLPSATIVIEWENAARAQRWRPAAMLRELQRQLARLEPSLPAPAALVLAYDPAEAVGLSELLAAADPALAARIELLPVPHGRYYQLKNAGARAAKTEIVVFLDSDCIPAPGWLEGLLIPLARPEVGAVCGVSRLGPEQGLLARSMGLYWFIPEPPPEGAKELVACETFFAHGVALRARIAADHPFPDSMKFRGQCREVARELCRRRVGIFQAQGAGLWHPTPSGPGHFFSRAMAKGHDRVVGSSRSRSRALLRTIDRWRSDVIGATRRILAARHRAGFGPLELAAAIAVAACWWSAAAAGSLLAIARPDLLQQRLRM